MFSVRFRVRFRNRFWLTILGALSLTFIHRLKLINMFLLHAKLISHIYCDIFYIYYGKFHIFAGKPIFFDILMRHDSIKSSLNQLLFTSLAFYQQIKFPKFENRPKVLKILDRLGYDKSQLCKKFHKFFSIIKLR